MGNTNCLQKQKAQPQANQTAKGLVLDMRGTENTHDNQARHQFGQHRPMSQLEEDQQLAARLQAEEYKNPDNPLTINSVRNNSARNSW